MAENTDMNADRITVLEPGDDRAKKIAKAMASETASEILTLLRGSTRTSSQIAEQLSIPITTVQYHLENLLAADMLEVVEKKWSKKGREVKVYGLRDQVLIVAPNTTNLRALLLKYAALFMFIAASSVVIAAFAPMFGIGGVSGAWGPEEASRGSTVSNDKSTGEATGLQYTPAGAGAEEDATAVSVPEAAPSTLEAAAPTIDAAALAALSFFYGGFIVLFALMVYELLVRPRLDRRKIRA
jgi:DNA-binding transcriptional ArsR family regulator